MIGQTIVGAAEVEPFVFDSCPEIPFPGDEEAVVVAKIVVERIAATKFTVIVAEIAAQRVDALRGKKIARVLLLWSGGSLDLWSRTGEDGRSGEKEQSA